MFGQVRMKKWGWSALFLKVCRQNARSRLEIGPQNIWPTIPRNLPRAAKGSLAHIHWSEKMPLLGGKQLRR